MTTSLASNAEPFTAVGDSLKDFRPQPFWLLLTQAAQQYPERTAIIYKDFALSYRQLDDLVARVAAGLQKIGVGKGDRVGVCMPNHPAAVVSYYAVMRSGATVSMLSPIYAVPTLVGQARDSKFSLIITLGETELLAKIETVAFEGGIPRIVVAAVDSRALTSPRLDRVAPATLKKHILLTALMNSGATPDAVTCDPTRDVAAIQYSGGTTGAPKGVMLTHANLHAAVCQFRQTIPVLLYGQEVFLAVGPFFHIAGLNGLLGPAIGWAATVLIIDRFDPTETALDCIKYRVSYMAAVPTLYFALCDVTEKMFLTWPDLKCALSGGAPLPAAVKGRFETLFGKPLLHAYGLTECSPVVSVPPPGITVPAECCGAVVPGAEIQIRSPTNPGQVMPPGEIGEICVRGPQVMPGYWHRPKETGEAFIDGFVRTGDLGYLSQERLLYLVDRLKDIIICSGYNVYPVRVEEAIFKHPAVSEAIVIGVPDAYRGETVKAFISLRSGFSLSLEELQNYLKPLLSSVEMPRLMEIRDQLPRSAVGKLSRLRLREEIAAAKQ